MNEWMNESMGIILLSFYSLSIHLFGFQMSIQYVSIDEAIPKCVFFWCYSLTSFMFSRVPVYSLFQLYKLVAVFPCKILLESMFWKLIGLLKKCPTMLWGFFHKEMHYGRIILRIFFFFLSNKKMYQKKRGPWISWHVN